MRSKPGSGAGLSRGLGKVRERREDQRPSGLDEEDGPHSNILNPPTAITRSATVAARVETLAYGHLCTAGSVRSVEGFGFQSSSSRPHSQNRLKIPRLLPSQRCGAHERRASRHLLSSTDLAGDLAHYFFKEGRRKERRGRGGRGRCNFITL